MIIWIEIKEGVGAPVYVPVCVYVYVCVCVEVNMIDILNSHPHTSIQSADMNIRLQCWTPHWTRGGELWQMCSFNGDCSLLVMQLS